MSLQIRNFLLLGVMLVIMVGYTNCGGGFTPLADGMLAQSSQISGGTAGAGGTGTGGSGGSSVMTCDDTTLQELYKNSFHSFMRSHTCVGCHSGSSSEAGQPPPLASSDLAVAYGAFKLKTVGTFLNVALTNNASSSAHNGAGSSDYAAEVQGYNTSWIEAVKTNCKSENGSVAADFVTKEIAMTLAQNAVMRYTFKLDEVSPLPTAPKLMGMTLSLQVQAAAATTPQDGYFISALRLTTGSDGLAIAGFKILINGEVYEDGTTFAADHVDIPAGMSEYPVTIGTMFIPATRAAGDKISISIRTIETPSLRQNGSIPDPKATAPTYSTIPRYSELVAAGGVLSKHCASCHNATFKTAAFNILDAATVMKYVGPTATGSALWRKLSANTTSNVMPPQPDRLSQTELNLIKAWIDGGAPQ